MRCPAEPLDVLILESACGATDGARNAAVALRQVLSARSDCRLGLSHLVPWARTAEAYVTAVHVLSQTNAVEPAVVAGGRLPLGMRLPERFRGWGRAVLEPTAALPAAERQELLDICGRALTLGSKTTSSLVGIAGRESPFSEGSVKGLSRNTVPRRVSQLLDIVGLPDTPAGRAVLHLALALGDLPGEGLCDRPSLDDVLDSTEAKEWATELIGPLSAKQLETLKLWTLHGSSVKSAAAVAGVTPRAFTKRLSAIGMAVSRQLHGPPWEGRHEIILALAVLRVIDRSFIPDPEPMAGSLVEAAG